MVMETGVNMAVAEEEKFVSPSKNLQFSFLQFR
jgi:hypothetical protein